MKTGLKARRASGAGIRRRASGVAGFQPVRMALPSHELVDPQLRGRNAATAALIPADVARWRILMIVRERQPVSFGEMAEHAIMEPSTVMRAMQRLHAEDLIRISTRASDARVSEAVLTPAGTLMMQRVLKAASHAFRQAFASFVDGEIEQLNGLLRRVLARCARRSISRWRCRQPLTAASLRLARPRINWMQGWPPVRPTPRESNDD
jgi:DNA-binding MarR family transcriptional regulator